MKWVNRLKQMGYKKLPVKLFSLSTVCFNPDVCLFIISLVIYDLKTETNKTLKVKLR